MTTLSIGLAALLIIALLLLLTPLMQNKEFNKDKITKNTIIAIAVFVPTFSMASYFALGTPQFADVASKQEPAPIQTLVEKLEIKLKQKPNDYDGWLLLGRSYSVTKENQKAIHAYEKALALKPNSLEAILPLADTIAVTQSGSLNGRPYELLKQAYLQAPTNKMTLWLLGIAEKQQGNTTLAKTYWHTLYTQLPADSEDRIEVTKMLAGVGVNINKFEQKTAVNEQPKDLQHATQADKTNLSNTPSTPKTAGDINITFKIDQETKQKIASATIFIYAKQPQGMPMPIAAQRYKGKNLPSLITLTKANELMPSRTLKQFNPLIIGVKISLGDANSQDVLYKKELQIHHGDLPIFIIKL